MNNPDYYYKTVVSKFNSRTEFHVRRCESMDDNIHEAAAFYAERYIRVEILEFKVGIKKNC